METKICSKCSEEKPIEDFYKISYCKVCRIKQIRDNYEQNKEIINQKRHDKRVKDLDTYRDKARQYYQDNKESIKAKTYQWNNDNKDKVYAANKKWRECNKDKIKTDKQEWISKNRDKVRETQKKRIKYKTATDINYLLSKRIRERTRSALKGKHKPGSLIAALGCTIEELKIYLESKFQDGMSWDNWTTDGWHLDHIVPLSSFDLTSPEEFKKACHYTNLQPLWAKDNLRKGAKIPPRFNLG